MLRLILLFLGAISTTCAFCQNENSLPYIGGTEQFNKDFSYVMSNCGKNNDTAVVYFVNLSYDKKGDSIKLEFFGSQRIGTIYEDLNRFLLSTRRNWDTTFLKKIDVVLPIFIKRSRSGLSMDKEKVDWPQYLNVTGLKSKVCFLAAPFTYFSFGECIDN